jgi:DNA gyrase subunit B
MNFFKEIKPVGEDYREGVTAIVSIQHPEPQFESQNKIRLLNSDVDGAVQTAMNDVLARYLEENPAEGKRIVTKVLLAAEAREAAAKARKALKDRKSILSGGGLPGKLFDCTSRNPDESELFLVEGDSAGGSAEAGRDRRIQAVLPLRGKPLNVEKARLENLLNNNEIIALISAIGVDIGNEKEYPDVRKGLRYNRVIIMTDADVDGQHIRTLLLTFFYRQMNMLVANGHIFVARPPLYKVVQKKQARYVATREQMTVELLERGLKDTRLVVYPPGGGGDESVIEGDVLKTLSQQTARLDEALVLLERRGIALPTMLARITDKGMPAFKTIAAGIATEAR